MGCSFLSDGFLTRITNCALPAAPWRGPGPRREVDRAELARRSSASADTIGPHQTSAPRRTPSSRWPAVRCAQHRCYLLLFAVIDLDRPYQSLAIESRAPSDCSLARASPLWAAFPISRGSSHLSRKSTRI